MKMYCEVCGGPLSVWTKNRICSDRCRAKRSRDKREATKRAHDMAFTVTGWSKMLSQEVITPEEAEKLLYTVWDTLGDFYRQIQKVKEASEASVEG